MHNLSKKSIAWALVVLLLVVACEKEPQSTGQPSAMATTQAVPTTFESPLPTPAPPAEPLGAGGNVILFLSHRDGSQRYYTMAPDGSNVQALTLGDLSAAALLDRPRWIPVLDRFLLTVSTGNDSEIYVVNWDGSDLVNLTQTPMQVEEDPTVSPDGKYIAFVAVESDLDVLVMRSDGSERQNLTQSPGRDAFPQWSPDGKHLLIVSNLEGSPNIFVLKPDGSDRINLSQGGGQDTSASWSPDGRHILFLSDRDGKNSVYVMDAKGRNATLLTDTTNEEMEPQWSPDGTQIAFYSNRDGGWDLFVMQADGSNQVNLTGSPQVREFGASWSPDSRSLIYTAKQEEGTFEIYVVGVDGSPPRNLTNNPADDLAPAWFLIEE